MDLLEGAVPGNRVELVVDGPACRVSLLELIQKAEHRVHLATFIFRADEAGLAVAEALTAAARRGVEARVLWDPKQSTSALMDRAHSPGSERVRAHADLRRELENAGVKVATMRPAGRRPIAFGGPIDHRKLAVGDDTALVMSHGVSDTYLYPEGEPSGHERWHDATTRVAGPAVELLDGVFAGMWNHYAPDRCERSTIPSREAGSHEVVVLDAGPAGNPELRRLYRDVLPRSADTRMIVENPYAVDETVFEAWAQTAADRPELRITLIRPHPAVNDYIPPRAPGAQRVAEWVLRRHDDTLTDAGVEVREGDRAFAHLKLAAVDGTLAVHGSYNLSYRSATKDPELAIVVQGPEYPRQVLDLLEADAAAAQPAGTEGGLPRALGRALSPVAGAVQRLVG